MKILFVPSDNNFTSGAFRSMSVLNRILNQEWHIDTLVVLPREGDGVKLLDEYKIKYTYIESYNWIVKSDRELTPEEEERIAVEKELNKIAIQKFVDLINKEKPDLIHINTTYSYVAAEAAQITKVPLIWHLREFLEEDQARRIYDKEYGYSLIGKADKIITISKALYKKYENILPKDKMCVIYNGIDTDQFYAKKRSIFKKDKVIFICAGSVSYNKGQDTLVRACGKLYKSGFKNFELWLPGTCSEHMEKEINGICKKYGIKKHVKLLGRRDDVDVLMKQSDIAFMCSKFEAFGRVTVEAMLAGNLLIGANTGGTLEIIEDGKTGLLYQQGSVNDLYKKIVYALNNKELMKKIAAAGRDAMYKDMSARRNARDIANLYYKMLNRKKVIAVVVTYNRKAMLEKCIDALKKQTYKDMSILVVDNASTDGTAEYLESIESDKIAYVNTGSNLGGAGGFYVGVKEAYERDAQWVWLMDDDVIPYTNALEELINATRVVRGKASFFASAVLSMDGQAMNTPGIDLRVKNGYPYWYEYLDHGIIKINAATFVSIMVKRDAIARCGYPCKDFFIWGDDSEYTKRLYRHYANAYFVGKSKVIHMREGAAALSIYSETNPNRVKMYFYMVRNTLTYTKEYADKKAYRKKLNEYRKDCWKLFFSRDKLKWLKIKTIRKGINAYIFKKYNYEAFEKRLDINYDYSKSKIPKTYLEYLAKRICRKIQRGYQCYKENGLRYTLRRILYGKKRGLRYRVGRAVTYIPRKIEKAIGWRLGEKKLDK